MRLIAFFAFAVVFTMTCCMRSMAQQEVADNPGDLRGERVMFDLRERTLPTLQLDLSGAQPRVRFATAIDASLRSKSFRIAVDHRYRQQLNAQLESEIARIDRQAELTEWQIHKARLAGRGDISRVIRELDSSIELANRLAETVENLQSALASAVQLSQEAQQARNGLFGRESLFRKTLNSILSETQRIKLFGNEFQPTHRDQRVET